MERKRLGTSDVYVSELTLGGMSLSTNIKEAERVVKTAMEAGVNHIDTADLYDFGVNEEVIGRIITNNRSDIAITSKVGNHFNKNTKDWFWDPSKNYILEAVKNSLKRLNTDYLDFCMLHGGTIDDPMDETIEAFEQLKKEGYIRTYGISSIRPNVIREYVKRSEIDGVMMQYSMFDRRPEEEILELLSENDISVLARGPLAKGMLSDKGLEISEKKGADGYMGYSHSELKEAISLLEELFPDNKLNHVALNYVLAHQPVTSAVFGASTVEQVEENIRYMDAKHIVQEKMESIQGILKNQYYEKHR